MNSVMQTGLIILLAIVIAIIFVRNIRSELK